MTAKEQQKEKLTKELQGMGLTTVGAFILLSFLTFNAADVSWNSYSNEGGIHNLGGRLGAQVADLFFICFGLASYLIPLALLYMAYTLFRFKEIRLRRYKLLAFAGLTFCLCTLFAFFRGTTEFLGQQVATGGAVGVITARALKGAVGTTGAMLLLLPLLAASIMILSKFSFVLFAGWWWENLKHKWAAWRERRELNQQEQQREKAKQEGMPTPNLAAGPVIKPASPPPARPNVFKKEKEKKKEAVKTAAVQETFEFLKADGDFRTPPFSLLDLPPATEKKLDRDALTMNARLLEKKLKDYGIDGEVVEICPGPVITMYEFSPAPGIKISRIAGLSDDLTMALQAMSIRIVAPIPGKGVVGIEVPNRDREMVFLNEIFNCDEFHHNRMKLPLALGKDIAGVPVVTDLAKAPHLLVAGSTGSGKSVSINTMILSLLYTATPNDVRMIMVDPKMLEFSMYEGIPHLLLPVVTEPKKASLALKWAVNEMERRYKLMSDKGVRNIESYNKKLAGEALEVLNSTPDDEIIEELEEIVEGEGEPQADSIPFVVDEGEALEHTHLPYIVVVVDELADLMMVAGREVEEHIARLAQKARASGIHLILATQRPSVDVITGLIKANLPSRISFQVTSKVDSRTILDTNGAEALLGAGDMLYMPPGTSRLNRIHGAFVSDAEVQRVVDFLKKQGKPVYDKSIMEMKDADERGSDGEQEELDERWEDALRLVADTRQASISMVQRRLRIGYNRAARIVEMMEQEGMIAPSDGTSKPREIYLDIINAYLNSQLTR
ncbi:DNA translocase FtsK [Geobacter sp. SVR]|uniref:DNA translocase FtsK n=1 Tax=Geobacter sp. SVR TaxID=2495594 RepID=UPI00143EF513|nr:DNA translocase FtsK [Geobacter sp. SVR]BCS56073.1 DNA translocase FtsK [Geobacter sp. SVR]GCF84836.1 DNA translocase FtsK [Geobacter sp. SVR]